MSSNYFPKKDIEEIKQYLEPERQLEINEWCKSHCPKCEYNLDKGTEFVNYQAECEVQKDIGIACIHYEEAHDIEPLESEDMD